jgi:hypothetical protein
MANKFLTVAIPCKSSGVVRVRKADKSNREVQMHDSLVLARAMKGGKRAPDFQAEGQIGWRDKNHQWSLTK